jgi:hypothetical protein
VASRSNPVQTQPDRRTSRQIERKRCIGIKPFNPSVGHGIAKIDHVEHGAGVPHFDDFLMYVISLSYEPGSQNFVVLNQFHQRFATRFDIQFTIDRKCESLGVSLSRRCKFGEFI